MCLAAHAAPPLTRGDASHTGVRFESMNKVDASSKLDAAAKFDSAMKLDLRLPATADQDARKPFGRFEQVGSEMQSESLHASAEQTRVGGVEAMAQRFRHEGLPVARLWENHAALISLGLNSKGKPGIWLVQKIH